MPKPRKPRPAYSNPPTKSFDVWLGDLDNLIEHYVIRRQRYTPMTEEQRTRAEAEATRLLDLVQRDDADAPRARRTPRPRHIRPVRPEAE
jgi:hypothetical protein